MAKLGAAAAELESRSRTWKPLLPYSRHAPADDLQAGSVGWKPSPSWRCEIVKWLGDAGALNASTFAGSAWEVPDVELLGSSWDGAVLMPRGTWREISKVPEILRRFIRLVDRTPPSCAAFVRRYGSLHLTSDWLPRGALGRDGRPGNTVCPESVFLYRLYAQFAAAILRTGRLLYMSAAPKTTLVYAADLEMIERVWDVIRERSAPDGLESRRNGAFPFGALTPLRARAADADGMVALRFGTAEEQRAARYYVSGPMNWWLDSSRARPYVAPRTSQWVTGHTFRDAWGAIGHAMAASLSSVRPVKLCCVCSWPLNRSRIRAEPAACEIHRDQHLAKLLSERRAKRARR